MAATRRAGAEPIEQRVVDSALAIAAEVGWDQVRLSTIADRPGCRWPRSAGTFAMSTPSPMPGSRGHGWRCWPCPRRSLPGDRRTSGSRWPSAPGSTAWPRIAGSRPRSSGTSSIPPSAPLGAAGVRPVAVGARSLGRGAGARFRPAAAGPGDRSDRDHSSHLGGLAPGRQSDQEHSKRCLRQRLARAGRLARWMWPAADAASPDHV